MTTIDDPSARVADPRVAAALQRIAESAGIDLAANPAVFDEVYRKLHGALSQPDQAQVSPERP